MLNAEAVVTLMFGVLIVSVFAFVGFPVLHRNRKIDAVLGALWNSTPVKGIRTLVVGFVVFLLVLYFAVCVYYTWLRWIEYVKQKQPF